MYDQTAQTSQYRRTHTKTSRAYPGGHRGRKEELQERERIRLLQLLTCLLLFLAVFVGKGIFPEKMLQVRDNILSLITSDVDFRSAFAQLGDSLSEPGTALDSLGEFCVEVFGTKESQIPAEQASYQIPEPENMLSREIRSLSQLADRQSRFDHYLYATCSDGLHPELEWGTEEAVQDEAAPEETPAAVPAAGTLLLAADYDGKALPANYTMDHLSLGELETFTPVLGRLNSEYGYRDHPINGKYQFHSGVDIGGQKGDPIHSFARGIVSYVGKNDSYGLYLQIDHGNGVKSFYAHCNKIVVSKGETVEAGEKIAEVGSSGSATGPHLHFELKYEELRLNPTYYIEFLSSE